MPRIICKIPYQGQDYYLLYSTISDSFLTYGVSLERFTRNMAEQEGSRYMEMGHPRRMSRVERFGTSSMNRESVEELIVGNRCGPNEEELSLDQIIHHFVARKAHRL